MSDKYINKTIKYIDSHNKQPNETHSNFSQVINIDKDVDTVVMLRCVIKKSYYLIQQGQNTFTLKEGSNTITIKFEEGNYSASSFKNILQQFLNLYSPNGFTYAVSLPNQLTEPSTGKYSFFVTGNGSIQPEFIFTEYLYEMFGFESNSTNSFINNSLKSKNIVNFQLKDTLRIHSNIVTDLSDNILQEVTSSTTGDFSSIRYKCLDIEAHSKPFNIKINTFKFKVLDEDGLPINLSLNVLFTLMFYKKNSLTDIANKTNIDYIKFQLLKNK